MVATIKNCLIMEEKLDRLIKLEEANNAMLREILYYINLWEKPIYEDKKQFLINMLANLLTNNSRV